MVPGSILGARLRAETLTAHASIEEVALGTGFLEALPAYVAYLRRMRGFYVAIERALGAEPELSVWLPDLEARRKASLLEADLLALGETRSSIDALPLCDDLAVGPGGAWGLGASYVVEGATLGGRYILSRLDRSVPEGARLFFQGYGARTGPMWRSFCDALARHSATMGTDDTVVAAALGTFRAMERWLENAP